jgi:hypothetical protein
MLKLINLSPILCAVQWSLSSLAIIPLGLSVIEIDTFHKISISVFINLPECILTLNISLIRP